MQKKQSTSQTSFASNNSPFQVVPPAENNTVNGIGTDPISTSGAEAQPLAAEVSNPTAKKAAVDRIEAEKLRRGRRSLRLDLSSVVASALGSGIAIPQ
jgi:hypothetical protein